jgi:hypothetical protein
MYLTTSDVFPQTVEKEYSLQAEIMFSAASVHGTGFIESLIILK